MESFIATILNALISQGFFVAVIELAALAGLWYVYQQERAERKQLQQDLTELFEKSLVNYQGLREVLIEMKGMISK
jgi:hypothetical protein